MEIRQRLRGILPGFASFFIAICASPASALPAFDEVREDFRRTMHGAGVARFTRDEQMTIAAADIAAVADLLADKDWLFGQAPSAVDAVAYGVLAGCSTRFFDSPLADLVAAHANLTAYLARIEQAYFVPDRWPSMG